MKNNKIKIKIFVSNKQSLNPNIIIKNQKLEIFIPTSEVT